MPTSFTPVQELLRAAKVVLAKKTASPAVMADALTGLEEVVNLFSEPGFMATAEEVDEAYFLHNDEDVDVDSCGLALVSHGDDGYWVSAAVFVPKKGEEAERFGYQIVNANGVSVHGDPGDPFSLNSWDLLIEDAEEIARLWCDANPGYRVQRMSNRDVQDPVFLATIYAPASPAPDLPVTVVDEEWIDRDGTVMVIGRFATIADAEAYIDFRATHEREKVERGGFGINAPEEMLNPSKS